MDHATPSSPGACEPPRSTLILGWRGGVGRALLGLWAEHPALEAQRRSVDQLLLLDALEGPDAELPGTRTLPARSIDAVDDFRAVLDAHPEIDEVLDLSSIDSMACIEVCAHRGVRSLNTSLEHWFRDTHDRGADHNRILHDCARVLPDRRPSVPGSHLIGSGTNPGIVNALAEAAIEAFADRVGTEATPQALELYLMYVTEEDTTVRTDGIDDVGRFAITWRPRGCLEEVYEPAAGYVRHGEPVDLPHMPSQVEYRARCGDRLIDGHVVPHDELVSLGYHYPSVELAFVYRMPPAARRFLAQAPTHGDPLDYPTTRLYPPHVQQLRGYDRVGILLGSRRYGELWMGFQNAIEDGLPFGTNATELQVASGVVAGWELLGTVQGIHTVEELDAARFLARVRTLLGPPRIVYDPHAEVRPLPSRRVSP